MAAVRAEDVVVLVQVERHAHRGGLLAHRKVRGAGVVVGDALVLAGGFDEVEHCLKLAQHQHVAVDIGQLGVGEVAHLVLDGFLVGIDRDVLKMHFARLAKRVGVDKQLLGHVDSLLRYFGCEAGGLGENQSSNSQTTSRMISETVGWGKMISLAS